MVIMFRRIRLLSSLILLSIFRVHAPAQPVGYWVDSLEVIAGQSSQIVVGKVVEYSGEDGWDKKRTVTIAVSETIKGDKQPTLSIQVNTRLSDIAWMKKKGSRVLVALGKDIPWKTVFVNLDEPDQRFTTSDFRVITSPQKAIDLLKSAAIRYPDSTQFKSFHFRLPKDASNDWRTYYPDQFAMGVTVPVDGRLKGWAMRQLRSKNAEQVILGLQALNLFKDPEINNILKRQLKSPITTIDNAAENNWGIEVQSFAVRKEALRLLESRKIEVDKPELTRTIPRFDTVKSLFGYDPLTASLWDQILKCKVVEKLQITGKGLGEDGFAKIGQLKSLKSINMPEFWDATPAKMKSLASLPNLEEVFIPYAQIDNDGLEAICEAPNLHRLEINNGLVTDKKLEEIRKSRPEIDIQVQSAESPIGHQVYYGDIDRLKNILTNRPEYLEIRDNRGYTPLHIAVSNNQVEVARYLLDIGASVDSLDKENKTPLMIASSQYYPSMAMMRLLVNRGADVNRQDRNGNTALHLAVGSAATQQIPFLLACGANPLLKNDDGFEPHKQNPRYNRESISMVSQIADLMAKPIKFYSPTTVDCRNVFYTLSSDQTTPWTTDNNGSYSGPIQWSLSPSKIGYLGPFSNQPVNLQLKKLPQHQNVTVEFDLWIIGSWDGNGGVGNGPDILDVQVPGVGTLLHSTFFNNNEGDCSNLPLQSFPDPYLGGFHPGYTGASLVKKLGFIEENPRDAVYHLKMTFAHTGSELAILFRGLLTLQDGGFKLGQDEMWGIGSLKVSTD
jgi:ankyrin repeat protein